MGIMTIVVYFIASIVLGFILSRVEGKIRNNLFDYVIISNIYMVILSGIFDFYNLTENNDNIFVIVVLLVLGKIFYLSLIRECNILRGNSDTLKKYIITLVSSYIINILVINRVDNIFPSSETIKLLVWLFIIGYTLLYVKNNIDIKISFDNKDGCCFDREYVVMQYAKCKSRYGNLVLSKYSCLDFLIYSIMIYENYNRPELVRKIDMLKYKLFRDSGKYGIMQINSREPISDEESIKLSIKKLEKIYNANVKEKMKDSDIIKILIKKYYKKDIKDIAYIYQIINNFNNNIF